ncbi:hypothetical protein TNCV_4398081 [Trichonephila clavipes]|nr:hypothetical protein TNCV_4398081 [Trichonephila clavipes]
MDVCKCIVSLWHGGTLNSRLTASALVSGRGREDLANCRMFSLKIGVEPSQNLLSSVWCSKLRLTKGVHLALFRDEFCGPRSDNVREVALLSTTLIFGSCFLPLF